MDQPTKQQPERIQDLPLGATEATEVKGGGLGVPQKPAPAATRRPLQPCI